MPMYRIPCVKYRQINHLCIFASGPNLVLNIFLINQGMFSVGGNTEVGRLNQTLTIDQFLA